MATIRNRNGRWRVQIRRSGQPHQFRSFTRKADARAWAHEIEAQIERGTFVSRAAAERTSVAELLDRYAEEVTPQKATAAREVLRIRLLKQHLGVWSLSRLRPQEIAAFRDRRLAAGLAGATVIKELNTLSHAIDRGRKEWGIYLPENPVKLVSRPKAARGRDRRLASEELDALMQVCRESRAPGLPVIVELAIETAMRLGELVGLEWKHISLDRRTAYLPDTKNGEARTVPLSSLAVRILERWPRSGERVFPQWSSIYGVENVWRRAVSKAGIADFRFHDLRHEATSRLFERGLNPLQVSAITGHKSLQMLKRYTHLQAHELAKLLD